MILFKSAKTLVVHHMTDRFCVSSPGSVPAALRSRRTQTVREHRMRVARLLDLSHPGRYLCWRSGPGNRTRRAALCAVSSSHFSLWRNVDQIAARIRCRSTARHWRGFWSEGRTASNCCLNFMLCHMTRYKYSRCSVHILCAGSDKTYKPVWRVSQRWQDSTSSLQMFVCSDLRPHVFFVFVFKFYSCVL